MTKTILLTGSTGFVGRQVLKELKKRSVKIRLIVREDNSNGIDFNDQIEPLILTPDLFSESLSWWQNVLCGVDTVIHVAWYAEPGLYLQSAKNLDCLSGTLTMAKACANSRVRRFVGVGTCFEYDLEYGLLKTTTPLKPGSPYASSKAAAFLALSQWLPSQAVEFAWCRLFYLYGEGEDERRLVPYIRKQLQKGEPAELTSGKQIRDFLDVAEAGRILAETALNTRQGSVNICSGVPITVRQLAEKIADEYGRRDLLKFGVRPDNLIDPPCVVGII